MRSNILHTFLLMLISLIGLAQDRRNQNNSRPDSLQTEENSYQLDTTIYNYIYSTSPKNELTYSDTTLHNFHIYDPTRTNNAASAHLGNLGSPALGLVFDNFTELGFALRKSNFSQYNIHADDLQFFVLNRPFNDFFFSPGQSQQDFIFKSRFSRNFKNDINLSISYQRINQEGYYNDQNTKSTSLGIGIWKKYDNHDLFFTAMINAHNATQNGGITSDTLLGLPLYNFRERIPTNISAGQTRKTNHAYALNNHFYLNDTVTRKFDISIKNKLSYQSGSFKYFDDDLTSDQMILYDVTDTLSTGIRNFVKYKTVENSTYIKAAYSKILDIKAGLKYKHHFINQEPNSFEMNNLLLDGEIILQFLPIASNFTLGLWDDAGSYNLNVTAELLNTKRIIAQSSLRLYRNAPTWFDNNLYINQREKYSNNFEKIRGQEIRLLSTIPALKLIVDISAHRVNNSIYYTGLFQPNQYNEGINILQARLTQHTSIWKFNFIHNISYQNFSENIFSLPSLYADLDYYVETYIFKKKMLTRFGVNGRFIEPYYALAYSPVNDVFYTQLETKQDWVTLVDFYTSFKIKRFRSFVKLENLGSLIFDDVYFLIKDHPQNDFKIRVGVAWQIKD